MCFNSSSRITTSRRTPPAAGAALRTASGKGIVHASHQLFVLQHLVGMCHPLLSQVRDFLRDETIAEVQLLPTSLNHWSFSSHWPACAVVCLAATACASDR